MTRDKPVLTHSDARGARMVDVGSKAVTERRAVARGCVVMSEATRRVIESEVAAKGSVLATAQLAGIMAAKRTSSLIPLCHAVALDKVEVALWFAADGSVLMIESCCSTHSKTGVEMEALVAVSVAALCVYDMAKSLERGMRIGDIRLLEKSGGRSGLWRGEEDKDEGNWS